MFETRVAEVLTAILGNYIKPSCFSSDRISVAVWSGYVVLRQLELKHEVLSNPMMKLRRGFLGSMEIKIPWNRLHTDSVVITIDDVYVLIETSGQVDESDLQKQKIFLLEKMYNDLHTVKLQDDDQMDDGFTTRLRNKIIDNLEIHIRRIHIRLEDQISGDYPIALGLTVESLHARSTNEHWKPAFVESDTETIYKSIEMNHFSIYLNPDGQISNSPTFQWETCSLDQMATMFNYTIAKRFEKVGDEIHYILKPVDARAYVKVAKDPTYDIEINVDSVALALEEAQYCDCLYLLATLTSPAAGRRYQKFRPCNSVVIAPREWWVYAMNAIMMDIRERREKWSWAYMEQRRKDRVAYVGLWKRKRGIEFDDAEKFKAWSAEEEDIFADIERRRSLEDLMYFRHLGDRQIRFNKASPNSTASWSSVFGWGQGIPASNSSDNTVPTSDLEDVERTELYTVLGYDPECTISRQENGIYSRISCTFQNGSLTLSGDPGEQELRKKCRLGSKFTQEFRYNYAPSPFFEAAFENWTFSVISYTTDDSYKYEMSLQSIEVFEKGTDSAFSKLLSRKEKESEKDVFFLSMETTSLALEMEPFEIVYSPTATCWTRLTAFTSTPETMGAWDEIEMAALNEMVSLKARTEAKLEYLLANRVAMGIEIHIQAPVIIIPENEQDPDCNRLILDFGCADFVTKQLSRETDFYDTYHLKLSKMQIMTGHNEHLLDRFDINLSVQSSVLPSDVTLTRFKIEGDLPALTVRLSVEKYKLLLALAEKFSIASESKVVQVNPVPLHSSSISDWFAIDRVVYDAEDSDSDDTFFSVHSGVNVREGSRTRLTKLENELYATRREHLRLKAERPDEEEADYHAADLVQCEAKIASLEKEINEFRLVASLGESWSGTWYNESGLSGALRARLPQQKAPIFSSHKSNIDRHLLQLRFAVPSIKVYFTKLDDFGHLLIQLDGLNVTSSQHSYSSELTVGLNEIQLIDYPTAQHIISVESDTKFLAIDYKKCLPKSDKYNGYGGKVSIDIDSFKFHFEESIIVSVLDLFYDNSPKENQAVKLLSDSVQADLDRARKSLIQSDQVKIQVELKSMTLTFGIGAIIVQKTQLNCVCSSEISEYDGSISSLRISDLKRDAFAVNSIAFQAKVTDTSNTIDCSIGKPTLVVQKTFFDSLLSYVQNNKMMTYFEQESDTSPSKETELTLNCTELVVIVPLVGKTEHGLMIQVSRIKIETFVKEFKDDWAAHCIAIQLNGMSIEALMDEYKLMEALDFRVSMIIPLDENFAAIISSLVKPQRDFALFSSPVDFSQPAFHFLVEIDPICLNMTDFYAAMCYATFQSHIKTAEQGESATDKTKVASTPVFMTIKCAELSMELPFVLISVSGIAIRMNPSEKQVEIRTITIDDIETERLILSQEITKQQPVIRFTQVTQGNRIELRTFGLKLVLIPNLAVNIVQFQASFLDRVEFLMSRRGGGHVRSVSFEDTASDISQDLPLKGGIVFRTIEPSIIEPCLLEEPVLDIQVVKVVSWPVAKEKPIVELKLECYFDKNEIWFVKDATESNGIVLSCGIELCLDAAESKYNGSMNDIQVSTICTSEILIDPFCIVMDLEQKRGKIEMDFISSRLSYQTISLLSAISNYLQTLPAMTSSPSSNRSASVPEQPFVVHFEAKMAGLDFILTSQDSPIVQFHIDPFQMVADGGNTAIETKVAISCAMNYHNMRLGLWEPLVEPLTCLIRAKVAEAAGNQGLLGLLLDGAWTIAITSNSVLNANITEAFIECIRKTEYSLQTTGYSRTMHWIRNETGMNLRCWSGESSPKCSEIAPGKDQPLPMSTTMGYNTISLSLVYPNGLTWQPIGKIPIDRVGCRFYRMDGTVPANCIVDVTVTKNGRKMVVVRSTFLIENHTASKLKIEFTGGLTWKEIVDPGQMIAIPAHLATLTTGQLILEPISKTTTYTRQIVPIRWDGYSGDAQLGYTSDIELMRFKSTYSIFICSAVLTAKPVANATYGRRVLCFYPPYRIENLLASEIEYRIISESDQSEEILCGELRRTGKLTLHQCGWTDRLKILLRLEHFEWSEPLILPAVISNPLQTRLRPSDIDIEEEHVVEMTDVHGASLHLGVHLECGPGATFHLILFTPYWIINRTQLSLEFKHDPKVIGKEHRIEMLAGQTLTSRHATSQAATETRFQRFLSKRTSKKRFSILPSIPPIIGLAELTHSTDTQSNRVNDFLHAGYTNRNMHRGRVCVRLQDSTWSNAFGMDMAGTTSGVDVRTQDKEIYNIGISINLANEPFARTKVITLTPRYILVNTIPSRTIECRREARANSTTIVSPESHAVFHGRRVQVRFNSYGWEWSGRFTFAPGDFALRLRNHHTHSIYLLRVEIKQEGPCLIVFFREETPSVPPYRIENYSLETLRIHQDNVPYDQVLLPYHTCAYSWDEPLQKKVLIVDLVPSNARVGEFKLDQMGTVVNKHLKIQVSADGPTRVLRFEDKKRSSSTGMIKSSQQKSSETFTLSVSLCGFGVSICNNMPCELLYISFMGIELEMTCEKSTDELILSVKQIQMDNQMQNCQYPVVLSFPTSGRAAELIVKRRKDYIGIDFFEKVSIRTLPMNINLDWPLMSQMLQFAQSVVSAPEMSKQISATAFESSLLLGIQDAQPFLIQQDNPEQGAMVFAPSAVQKTTVRGRLPRVNEAPAPVPKREEAKLYFQSLHFHPIRATVSFAASNVISAATSGHVPLRHVVKAFANTVAKVENAPIRLNALCLSHSFAPLDALVNEIATHYRSQTLGQAYLILGSADFLGNPIRLIQNFTTGVYDFIYQPVQGLTSPSEFIHGVARGTSSLVLNSCFGIFDFITRISATIGLGFSDATLQLNTYTGYAPSRSLIESLAQGITGVVISPINGLELNGVMGFAGGVLAGFLGLVIQPTSHLFQLLSRTSAAIRQVIAQEINKTNDGGSCLQQRIRPPRYFDPYLKRLSLYSYMESIGEELISRVRHGQYRSDGYVGHLTLEDSMLLIITKRRVMCLENIQLYHCPMKWEIQIQDLILTESTDTNQMVLYFIPLRKFGIATEKVQLANLQEVHALNSMLKQGKSVLITRVNAQTQLSFAKDSSLDKRM